MTGLIAASLALSDMAAALGIADRFALAMNTSYRQSLRNLIQLVWNGDIDQAEFERRMKALINDVALAALIAGLIDAGVPYDELDAAMEDQQDELNNWLGNQIGFIAAFALAVSNAREHLDQRMPILQDRIEWWADSLAAFQTMSAARTEQRRDEPLTFDGLSGKESCATCQSLMLKTHPASWWLENNLVPFRGNDNFICGAWNCYHFLRNDQGVRRMP